MFDRNHRTKFLLGASALGLVWGFAGVASAQDAEPAQLDEVIVTAQLREQDPIEVPFALTAYNGDFLENLGVQDFEELAPFVPGLIVQNQSPNNPGFVIRGITSDSTSATEEPRVSIYQDGVSISRAPGAYVELFDIERVEVAKGPQSTLYGRGALIGAVNVIQNKADIDGFEGEVRLGIGNIDYLMGELMLNLPFGETAAVRLAGRVKTRGGYIDNLLGGRDYNSVDTQAYRALFAWQPSDAFRFDLIGNFQADNPSGVSFRSIYYDAQNPDTGAVLGGRRPSDGAALTPSTTINGGSNLGIDREVSGVTGLIRYDLSDSLTLTSTTAARSFETAETFDPDGISLPMLTGVGISNGEQFSQELRLNWDSGGQFSGFFGAGYFREESDSESPIEIDERIALAQLAGILDGNPAAVGTTFLPRSVYASQAFLQPLLAGFGIPAPAQAGIAANLKASHIENAFTDTELDSFDVFADLTWKPTDRWEFAAGVRYTSDDKTTAFGSSVLNGRSIAGGLLALSTQIQPQINALVALGTPAALAEAAQLGAFASGLVTQLATPGAATAPASAAFPLFGLTFQPTAGNGQISERSLEDDGFTWRVTGRYEIMPDASLYATYARGRRPAVLAASVPTTPFGAPVFNEVEEETVDSYEAGLKTVLADGALRLDGAVFFYDYQNFQTTIQVGTQFITTNAGEAESYGFEGQAVWAATDTLDLFGTYGYNRSRFQAGIFDGNRFRLSPDHKFSLGALWAIPVAGGAFEIQPTYTWQSEVFFDNDNDRTSLQTTNFVPDTAVDELQDSYGLLNLRVRYTPDHGNWSVEAFGDNLLDEDFLKDAGNTGDGLGLPSFIAGEPRTYGATLSVRY